MSFEVYVAARVALVALAVYFWGHCARPALWYSRGRPAAFSIVFGLSVLVVVAALLAIATPLMAPDWSSLTRDLATLVDIVYWIVVGLGFLDRYRLLIRLTGGPMTDRRTPAV